MPMNLTNIGQKLSTFLTHLGDSVSDAAFLYVFVGFVIFVASTVFWIRKQWQRRKVLFGFPFLAACLFIDPLSALPYAESYQTILLLIMVPFALLELRWKRLFTRSDWTLLNLPLWHGSLIYWVGCINEA